MTSDATFRNGPTDENVIQSVQRPLELDLEAAFRAMQEDAFRALAQAVREGLRPSEAIDRVEAAIMGGQDAET